MSSTRISQVKAKIQANNVELRSLSDACLLALHQSNDPPHLFIRGGLLVHIEADECNRMTILPVTPTYLGRCLTRAANFFKVTGEHRWKVFPPPPAIADVLSCPTKLGFPALVSVTETPLLRLDGSVVSTPGYDATTKIVYAPSAGLRIPPLPARPDASHARAAVAVVEDTIGDFPFADKSSRANAYALLLTPLVRPLISGKVPIALLDAPQAGNGKGLFIEVVTLVHTGSAAAMRAAPRRDDDEWRKLLTSVISAGNQFVVFDNVEDGLKSPSLAAAVTAEYWEDRILGTSLKGTFPQRCIFVITGNNLRLGGDLPRRTYWIRIDAKLSRPWMRNDFRHKNLNQWVRQNRGKLLHALLVMASAWYTAGCPPATTPVLGSFEEWSQVAGGVLAFAGVDGFLGNLPDLYESADPSEGQWEAFLRAIRGQFGNKSFTVAQLVNTDRLRIGLGLMQCAPDELEKADTRAIGRALLRRVDHRYGSEALHLVRDKVDRDGVVQWRVAAGA